MAPLGTPRRRSRGRAVAIGLVVVLVVGVIGSLVAVTSDGGKDAAGWDPMLEPLAHYVERIRGLDFKHPVDARFLDSKRFDATLTGPKPTAADRRDSAELAATLRAEGFAHGDVDLIGGGDQAVRDNVDAYYDPDTETLTVEGTHAKGTRLTAYQRMVVVHELTHALDDQWFDLDALDRRTDVSDFLGEGDAQGVEYAYYTDLSKSEQDEVDRADAGTGTDGSSDGSSDAELPEVLQVEDEAPYGYGELFMSYIDYASSSTVDDVFRDPPRTDAQILDPIRYFAHGKLPAPVAPKLRAGDHRRQDLGTLGALDLYMMLAQRLPAPDAWAAVRGWGRDHAVIVRRDTRVCIVTAFTPSSATGRLILRGALTRWAAGAPAAASVEVRDLATSGDADLAPVQLDACDPGVTTKATVRTGARDAAAQLYSRLDLLTTLAAQNHTLATATCAVDALMHDDAFAKGEPVDPKSAPVKDAIERCPD